MIIDPTTDAPRIRPGLLGIVLIAGFIPALGGCESNPGGPTSPSASAPSSTPADTGKAAPREPSVKGEGGPASDM